MTHGGALPRRIPPLAGAALPRAMRGEAAFKGWRYKKRSRRARMNEKKAPISLKMRGKRKKN